jgi:hypothetical protein
MIQVKLKPCHGCKDLKQIWKSQGHEKYCKDCWYKLEKPQPIKPRSNKMQKVMDQYTKKRLAFLAMYPDCLAYLPKCTRSATDIHHKAGRLDNHLNISTWLPVCRSCHQWIEEHPNEAKELGLSESRLNISADETSKN